mgnify:CR=1 FL=1
MIYSYSAVDIRKEPQGVVATPYRKIHPIGGIKKSEVIEMNQVNLLGRLTKDPELKYGASGNAYCKFTLAINRAFKKDEVDFISCTAFGKAAETIAEYVKKGDQFAIGGRIQVDVYESNGEKKYSTSVMVENFTFISKAKGEGSSNSGSSKPQNNEKPAGNQGAPNVEFEDDDEFPF